MSNTQQLYIPHKIKVGFQKREGTYTGKLAYVIYFDGKGVLRKEASWQFWRSEKITPLDLENVPTEGFVLNKGVGGARQSYGWNARNEYIRVYDPRDFEFEISVANLLFILRECDCNKGKGLEGQFVYSWQGTELVLLPVKSQDYQKSAAFTGLQTKGVKAKELIPGATYLTKRQERLVYLGRFDYHFVSSSYYGGTKTAAFEKKYVFWDEAHDEWSKKPKGFTYLKDLKSLAILESDTPVSNFAKLVDRYHKSARGSKVVRLFLKEVEWKELGRGTHNWACEPTPGVYQLVETHYQAGTPQSSRFETRYTLDGGVLRKIGEYRTEYPTVSERDYWGRAKGEPKPNPRWVETVPMQLFAEMESGATIEVNQYTFDK